MFMTDINDTKIYNLSAGKSLPDWLSERKARLASKKKLSADVRHRIELIQDFDMPGVASAIRVSPDGQYIIATGTYKPRVKCFDVNNLSIKFERCYDSEAVTFEVLSDDYSKLVFLQCDRYIEFHAAHGRHYRLRIPRFGRAMSYHKPSCDLFVVGTSSDIYRLNLERGQFMQPYETQASCINASEINPEHHLLCVGTQEGTVEAWDPRDKKRVSILDVGMNVQDLSIFPSVTALNFKNGLHMAVGTASGQVLLFDIRSKKPVLVKNHLNKLPIKKIAYNAAQNFVYSMDAAMLKIWDETTGKQSAFIESTSDFNDFCTIPQTGMFFFAQEDPKMMIYYLPSLGPAPRWCSFLDNLTEEIESETVQNIYDDYKFITKQELEELGMEHLQGTNLLRAYMHGFFIDIRLYNKAKAIIEPFAFEKYRKTKIRQQIDAARPSRLPEKSNLPKVNQEMAMKIIDEQSQPKKRKKTANLLEDGRFKAMFEDPAFEIDKNADEYKLLTPVLTRLDKTKAAKLRRKHAADEQIEEPEVNGPAKDSDAELFSDNDNDNDSSDSDNNWTKEMKKQYKRVQRDKGRREQIEDDNSDVESERKETVTELQQSTENGDKFKLRNIGPKMNRASLGDRLAQEVDNTKRSTIDSSGNRVLTFNARPAGRDEKRRAEQMKVHRTERQKLMRSARGLPLKKPKF